MGLEPPGISPSSPIDSQVDSAWRWNEFSCRTRSVHRRHGDGFPLPRLGKPMEADPLKRRLDGAFMSLNGLASAVFDKTVDPDLPLTRVQLWMMEDLRRRVSNYGERPEDLNEERSLKELGCGANLYTQEANHVADFDMEQIKILSRRLEPIPAADVSPPEVRAVLDGFEHMVERSVQEMEAMRSSGDLVVPHWDPKLKASRSKRMSLYKRLHSCGLLTFRRRQKAKVGMFAVVKKGNKPGNSQRLIVDCRQANALQRRPPSTRLSTPASLTDLDFSTEALSANGFDIDTMEGFDPGIDTGDVGDCFYNFVVERACSWFSTGDVVDRHEMTELGMDVDEIYDDDLGYATPLGQDEKVFVCFRGVPMGWSWALWLANEIVCHQCLLASEGMESELVRDKRPSPSILPDKPPIGVYVDNVHTFGGRRQDAQSRMRKIAEHFEKLGIPFEVDNVSHQPSVDSLGLTFFFDGGVRVRAKKDRSWRLWAATKAILRRRRVSGEVLRVWLGHVNYHFLLCRPLLSALSACYRFCHSHLGHRFPLWSSVRKEMKTVLGLIFVVEKNLSAPINDEVHVGDSSDRGYGLLTTQTCTSKIRRELAFQERWRFLESREPWVVSANNGGPEPLEIEDLQTGPDRMLGSTFQAGVGCNTQYGRELSGRLDAAENNKSFLARKQRLFGKPSAEEKTMIQLPGIPEVSDHWAEPTQWDLVTAAAWRHTDEHINVKEARVALMSLRRLTRTTHNLGQVCLTLSDNLCTVLAFERGRSSSGALNTLCRRAAAYSVGGGITWRLRYIRSENNPADEPSRRFGEDFVRSGRRQEVDQSLDAHFRIDSFEQGITPSAPSRPKRIIEYTPERKGFLELFAGTGNLSHAVKSLGLRVYPPFELAKDAMYNLLNKGTQDFVLAMISAGLVWWVHLGTPCCVWSRARHNIKDFKKARRKEQQGVATALFTYRVVKECLRKGVRFSIENPSSSRLWQFGPILELARSKQVRFVTWDMCQYGTSYRKRTTILTNEPHFQMLERQCTRDHVHEHLKGTVRAKIGGKWASVNKTSLAGAYPKSLCTSWAQIASQVCPVQALGRLGWHERQGFLATLQETGNSFDDIHSKHVSKSGGKNGHSSSPPEQQALDTAANYIRQHPVVFGQFNKTDIEQVHRKVRQEEEG